MTAAVLVRNGRNIVREMFSSKTDTPILTDRGQPI